VQTPDNLDEPAHRLARETAANGPWRAKLADVRHPPRHDARFYHALLRPVCRTVDVWRTTYFHVLQGGPSAVVEWFKGTALRPFLGPLDAGEQAEFLAAYTEAIAQAYPAYEDGSVLLPFPRLFIVATR
jgi:trans-aconitate 2-methyltransferase